MDGNGVLHKRCFGNQFGLSHLSAIPVAVACPYRKLQRKLGDRRVDPRAGARGFRGPPVGQSRNNVLCRTELPWMASSTDSSACENCLSGCSESI